MDSFSLPWIDYIGLLWITMDFYGLFPPLGSTSASWFPATPGFDHRAGRDRWDHHDDVRADRVLTKKRPGLAQHVPVWYLVWYTIYIYMIYVCICIYIYLYMCIYVDMYICRYVYMYTVYVSGKLTVRPWQSSGIGRFVSIKTRLFSGSVLIYQRVLYIYLSIYLYIYTYVYIYT